MTIEGMMDTMAEMVDDTLASCKFARNCDKRLTWEILTRYYKLDMPFEDFVKFPMFESIRRSRQKIQEDGRFRPTVEEVWVRRRFNQNEFHTYFAKDKTDGEIRVGYPTFHPLGKLSDIN